MGRVGLTVVVVLAVLAMVVLLNVGSVWAVTITPGTPTAGQGFTISGNAGGGSCGTGTIYLTFTAEPGSYSIPISGYMLGHIGQKIPMVVTPLYVRSST